MAGVGREGGRPLRWGKVKDKRVGIDLPRSNVALAVLKFFFIFF